MSHLYRSSILYALWTLVVLSCSADYDLESSAPHVFIIGEEIDAELSVLNIASNWEYDGAGLDRKKTVFLGLRKKADFSLDSFWSPLNPKECNEKMAEWFRERSCYSYTGRINSSLAFCDGPVRITCDQELFGMHPGENLSEYFTIRWQNRDVHPNVRVYGSDLVVIPMSEYEEYEPANEFFRVGECIPASFYIYPSQKTELSGITLKIEIPVLKEMLCTYIKELQSGNLEATVEFEKDTLHATIKY